MTMEFQTMATLVKERQGALRRDGEQVRRGRVARRRRALLRHHDRPRFDTL
jgi:hypothetical protein